MAHIPITPNTNLKILKNIPLENDYVNTLYFASRASQTTYFTGKAKYNLTQLSYQRVGSNVIRIGRKIEDLYDCNYIMFQNASFENKWFYAFITELEYVNNITTAIHYEIDVMQTWLLDMVLTTCFVEREHVADDTIGVHLLPEPIELGEYVFNTYKKLCAPAEEPYNDPWLDNLVIGVLTVDSESSTQGLTNCGRLIDGVYSGAKLTCFSTNGTGVQNLNLFIQSFDQRPDAIVGIYMLPLASIGIVSSQDLDNGYRVESSTGSEDFSFSFEQLTTLDTLDTYRPRNKKLYTYPFNYCHVNNGNGRELALRYEFFRDDNGNFNLTPQFKMHANSCMPITIIVRPKNYKGLKGGKELTSESIDLTQYPQCSWNIDSWTAWVAQNSIPEAMSVLEKGASTGIQLGALTGVLATNPEAILAMGAIGIATHAVGSVYKASIAADVCKGSLNNANINVAAHTQNFFIGRVSINRDVAKMADDFFDRFGYTVNKLKTPNITSRPAWNYIKTIGSNVGGNIPAIDKKQIDANFDRGITFWKDPSKVDDYSQVNTPI